MSKRTRRTTPPAGGDRRPDNARRSGGPAGSRPSTSAGRPAVESTGPADPTASETASLAGAASVPANPTEQPTGGSAARSAGTAGSAAGPSRPGPAGRSATTGPGRADRAVGTADRAGRRPRARTYQRSIFERYRSLIVGGGVVAGLLLFGAFVFLGSTGTAYACASQIDPVSPAPSPSGSEPPELGQVIPDMGRAHLNPGTEARYSYCPPGSGPHYNIAGRGPIAPRFYPPDALAEPQGWIHNLEHGAMTILYSCATPGACTDAALDPLRALASNFPASPICNVQSGVTGPVIARFDTMKTRYAAVLWNRVLLQDELDIPQMLEFYRQYAERNNPERQCALPTPASTPTVTFGTGSPAPSGSPAASDAASPASS